MTDFKIGGSPFRPTQEIGGAQKPAAKEAAPSAAPVKGGFDTASVDPNRLAVMPRMSTVSGSASGAKAEAVESLLHSSAEELDDFFTSAYGFEK